MLFDSGLIEPGDCIFLLKQTRFLNESLLSVTLVGAHLYSLEMRVIHVKYVSKAKISMTWARIEPQIFDV